MKSFYQLNEEQQKLAVAKAAQLLFESALRNRSINGHVVAATEIDELRRQAEAAALEAAKKAWYPADGDIAIKGIA
jgi:hypothetical protein